MDDLRSKGVLLATCVMVICCDVAFSLGCSGKQADIVFVVDASGSVGQTNWDLQLQFVEDVITSFEVGLDKVRIGMVTFDSYVYNQFSLKEFNDKTDMVTRVRSTVYTRLGTETWKAVQYIVDHSFTTAEGSRSGVPHIAIFLTDAVSENPSLTKSAAANLHRNTIHVFAVGIGNIQNSEELKALGTDPDSKNVFLVPDFMALNAIKTKVVGGACPGPLDPCYPDPCVNCGTCGPRGGDYACRCRPGYSGKRCEYDVCRNHRCYHGIYKRSAFTCSCLCNNNYIGSFCEAIKCGPPPNVLDGNVEKEFIKNHRQEATYGCNPMRDMRGSNTIRCQDDGTWQQAPHCIDPCLSNPCQNGGTCLKLVPWIGYVCKCQSGFRGTHCQTDNCDGNRCMNGATCDRNIGGYNCSCTGNYTHTYCHVRECGSARYVRNGWRNQIIRESDDMTGRQEALYYCNIGYDLRGESNITCQENGQWQDPPKCQIKDCGAPPNVSNSNVKYNATTYLSDASYTCDETHYMLGSSQVTCKDDGNWSVPPKCHQSFCQPDLCLNGGQCLEIPMTVQECKNVPSKVETSVTIETPNGSFNHLCSALYERSSLGRALHICEDPRLSQISERRHCIDFLNLTRRNHFCKCSYEYHGDSCEKGPYYIGGAMSWIKGHNSSNEILVTYRSQWKLGFGPCGFSCNVSDVGKGGNKSVGEIVVIFNETVVQTVDHKYHIEEVNIGHSSNDLDYEMGLGSFVIKLPNDTTDISNFSLRFQGSGWAPLSWRFVDEYRLNAFANGTFFLNNHSPAVANFRTLHYRYSFGCEHSLYLPLPDDVDGDVVRCRWATTEESGTASIGLPGARLDEKNCTVTFNATSGNHYRPEGFYAVNLIFEDFSDEFSFSPKSSVPLQILVTTSTLFEDCQGKAIEIMEPQTSSHVVLKGSTFRMKFFTTLPADGSRPRLKIVLGPEEMRVVKEEIVDDRLATEIEWKPKPEQSGRTRFCVAAKHATGSLLSRVLCQLILVNVFNPCKENYPYCKNGGNCILLPNDTSPIPSCDCPANFFGDLCEIDAEAEFESFHRSRAMWAVKTGFEPGASDLKWWHLLIISAGGIGLVLNLLFINFVLRKRETIERDQGPLQKYKDTNQRGRRRPIYSRGKVAPMPPTYNKIYDFEKKPGSFTVEPKVKPIVIPTYDELLELNYVDN